jgi:hypothetical protein
MPHSSPPVATSPRSTARTLAATTPEGSSRVICATATRASLPRQHGPRDRADRTGGGERHAVHVHAELNPNRRLLPFDVRPSRPCRTRVQVPQENVGRPGGSASSSELVSSKKIPPSTKVSGSVSPTASPRRSGAGPRSRRQARSRCARSARLVERARAGFGGPLFSAAVWSGSLCPRRNSDLNASAEARLAGLSRWGLAFG